MQILETGLYVDDLQAAEKFYVNLLGLELIEKKKGRHLFVRCKDRMLVIFNPQETNIEGGIVPPHGSRGAGHMAFGVSHKELQEWKGKLKENNITIDKEVTWETGRHSIYFRDPGHNSIEFIEQDHWDLLIK